VAALQSFPQLEPLHVGVIGVGRIGAFHARTLTGIEGVRAVTVCDADRDRARALATELGVGAVDSPEALIEAGVDALVIATPTPSHAPLLRLAARAGLPTFCEKPIGLDVETVAAVAEEVERARVLVQVGFQRRFDAGYRAAAEAVATGALGNLLVVRLATHDPSPPPEAYIASSGGIFRDLHIHDFDAVRFVTGQEVVDVYADGAVQESAWFADHGDVDVAVAVLRLSGGTLAILSGTRHDPLGYDVRLEAFGTRDSIAVGLDARSPMRSVEPGVPRPSETGYRDFMDRFEPAYRTELVTFVANVRTGSRSACSLAEAQAAMQIAVAADRSRAERRPIEIEEIARTSAIAG
jgi:myo-inositol 2-dehydrogenase / D-chiro-inositol 1-dehydrogenase